MNKHAYLIIAHNNWNILKKLLLLLDDDKNDIFLHIDLKADDFPREEIENCVNKSKIYIWKEKRLFWADYSLVDVTLMLMKRARDAGEYSYYHLLSGVDMPIKGKNDIYSFFEKSGREFIGIVPGETFYSVRRVKYYHVLTHNGLFRNMKLLKALDRVSEYIQRFFRVNRIKHYTGKIIDGWEWFSITDIFCQYVLDKEKDIKSMFSKSIAPDELVFQTVAYNSEFRERLNCESDLKTGSMRYIDWQRGRPYVWGTEGTEQDFEMLLNSPYLFARKFDEKVNMEIVDKIYDRLKEGSDNYEQ